MMVWEDVLYIKMLGSLSGMWNLMFLYSVIIFCYSWSCWVQCLCVCV